MWWLLLGVGCIFVIYLYSVRNHGYWAKRNIKHDKTIPFIGTHFEYLFCKKSVASVNVDLYNKYKDENLIGYYRGNTPEMIVKDPDMIRQILSVDFVHFYQRGLAGNRNPEKDELLYNLFSVEGDTWKLLRQRLTPAFTTGKLKAMFPLVIACAEKLQGFADRLADRDEYDIKELMARYTTEFIGACGFGIDMNTIGEEDSAFRALGTSFFRLSIKEILTIGLNELFPELTRNLNATDREKERKVRDMFMSIRKSRNYKPIGRNDFIDMLLELESKGVIEGESIEEKNSDGSPKRIQMNLTVPHMMAQMFVFYAAGFETSSSSTSYLLHELAYHPEIQEKIQKEIDEVLSRYDQLCYDALGEMKYLDLAFKEAMRKFPSLGVLHRVCMSRYTLPGTDITIDPGVKIMIPVQALHMDEQYYEDPEKFIPERFLPEEVQKRHKFVYLPFGEGPRNCIGGRLGYMQSMAGLAALLHKFSVEPSKSSKYNVVRDPVSHIVQSTINGIPLKITRRQGKIA